MMPFLRFELEQQLRSRFLPLALVMPLLSGVGLAVGAPDIDPAPITPTPTEIRVAVPDALADAFTSERIVVVARSPEGFEAIPDSAEVAVAPTENGWAVRGQRVGLVVVADLRRVVRAEWESRWRAEGYAPEELVVDEIRTLEAFRLAEAGALPAILAATLSLVAYGAANQAFTQCRQDGTRATQGLLPDADPWVLWSKTLAVGVMALLNALLTVVAWLVTAQLVGGSAPWAHASWAMVPVLALAAQLASVWSVAGAWAPDLRTLNFVSGFAVLLLMPLGAFALLPDLPPVASILPVIGPAAAVRFALEGERLGTVLLALAATLGWVAMGSRLTRWYWAREPGELRHRGPQRAAALGVLALALAWFLAGSASSIHPLLGLEVIQLGVCLPLALGSVAWLGQPMAETLSLRRPSPSHLLGALLLGLGTPALSGAIFGAQAALFGVDERFYEQLNQAVFPDMALPWILVLMAAQPAVFEELLFRGAMLGISRDGLRAPAAILLTSVFFALLHISSVRLPNTFVLGLIFGAVATRTRSLYPSMVAHFVHNAILLGTAEHIEPHTLPVGLLPATLGVALLARNPR